MAVPIQNINVEEIRGAIYIDAGTPGQIHTVKLVMMDGHIHVYHGEDLEFAMKLARERFRPEPGVCLEADCQRQARADGVREVPPMLAGGIRLGLT